MIISKEAEKSFDKIQYDKNSPESGQEGTYLNIMKAVYDKPVAFV